MTTLTRPTPPDLTRTATAVQTLDKAHAHFDSVMEQAAATDQEVEQASDAIDQAATAVGAAFALDTSDRNNPTTARLTRAGRKNAAGGESWLRELLRKYPPPDEEQPTEKTHA